MITAKIDMPTLCMLPSDATDAQRIPFIRRHIAGMDACDRRKIQHAWLAGRELVRIKENRPDLRGRAWNAFVKKHFGLAETQPFNLMRVYRGFPTFKAIPNDVVSVRSAILRLQLASGKVKVEPAAKAPRRTRLRVAQDRLEELAGLNPAAFRRVCRIIREGLSDERAWAASGVIRRRSGSIYLEGRK